jgi:hypothetical protein
MTDSRHDRRELLPPRVLPLLYYGVARVAFLAALGAVASDPVAFAAFFYHARMLAVVHLVTLGWLTCSILGSVYIVGPFALRVALPARAADYLAFGLATASVAGVVAGFWWNMPLQVGWTGGLMVPAVAIVAVRLLAALRESRVQRAVTLHVRLAFVNFFLAAAAGIAIAFDKIHHVLPGSLLSNVFAHAHLAAIGWVGMMAVGLGYRLFPMVLPAAMPEGRSLYASALLLEAGTLALGTGLVLGQHMAALAGALGVAAGFGAFIAHVRRMLSARRPAPAARPWPDYGAWQSLAAIAFLAAAVLVGLYLVIAPMSPWTLRVAAAYGVLGLVGFFAQLVAGMESRLLPYYAWYWAFANTDFKGPVPTPHEMPIAGLQKLGFFLWIAAVPLLATGMLLTSPPMVRAGAWILLAAVTIGAIDVVAIASHAFARAQRP